MQNLRDKLLKAGLVSEDQATKAATESQKAPRREARPPSPPRGRPHAPTAAHSQQGPMITARPQPLSQARSSHESAIPKLPPMPGSKAHQRIESKKQAELDKQLRDLVITNQVAPDVGATVFYFVTRKGKLRRLELTEAMAKQLEKGELAVVERPDPGQIEHALVPPPVAEQMLALLPKSVRFFNRPGAAVGFLSEDDIRTHQTSEAEETPETAAAAEASTDDAPVPTEAAEAPTPAQAPAAEQSEG